MGILDNIEEFEGLDHSDPAWISGLREYLEYFRANLVREDKDLKARYRETLDEIPQADLAWLAYYLTPGQPGYCRVGEAARLAGCKGNQQVRAKWGYWRRIKYAPLISQWIKEAGHTPEAIREVVMRWFDAKEPKFQTVKGTINKDNLPAGAKVVSESDNESTLFYEVENPNQLRAAEIAAKIEGMLKDKVDHEFPNGIPVTASLSEEDRALLKGNLEAVKKSIVECELAKDADKTR